MGDGTTEAHAEVIDQDLSGCMSIRMLISIINCPNIPIQAILSIFHMECQKVIFLGSPFPRFLWQDNSFWGDKLNCDVMI